MEYLARISNIENGKPVYSNEISDSKPVGEIRLQKLPVDNICNICCNYFKDGLSEDHVPPKCMGNVGLFHYVNLFNYMMLKEIKYHGISRNGIKYQTVCQKCNNEKLKIFDDAINALFSNFIETNISNKISIRLRVKPNKIIRGIMGHFLSAKTSHTRTVTEDLFAEAVNQPERPINKDFGFYVAPYLQDQVRVIRDLLINGGSTVINAIKINPLAFIVTYPKVKLNFSNWDRYFDVAPDDEYELEFFGSTECNLEYPERYYHPTLFGKNGMESIVGFPQR